MVQSTRETDVNARILTGYLQGAGENALGLVATQRVLIGAPGDFLNSINGLVPFSAAMLQVIAQVPLDVNMEQDIVTLVPVMTAALKNWTEAQKLSGSDEVKLAVAFQTAMASVGAGPVHSTYCLLKCATGGGSTNNIRILEKLRSFAASAQDIGGQVITQAQAAGYQNVFKVFAHNGGVHAQDMVMGAFVRAAPLPNADDASDAVATYMTAYCAYGGNAHQIDFHAFSAHRCNITITLSVIAALKDILPTAAEWNVLIGAQSAARATLEGRIQEVTFDKGIVPARFDAHGNNYMLPVTSRWWTVGTTLVNDAWYQAIPQVAKDGMFQQGILHDFLDAVISQENVPVGVNRPNPPLYDRVLAKTAHATRANTQEAHALREAIAQIKDPLNAVLYQGWQTNRARGQVGGGVQRARVTDILGRI